MNSLKSQAIANLQSVAWGEVESMEQAAVALDDARDWLMSEDGDNPKFIDAYNVIGNLVYKANNNSWDFEQVQMLDRLINDLQND